MKVLEQNSSRTWISSEAALWAKAICWAFAAATFSMVLWQENTASYVIAIIGGLFWMAMPTSIAETIFDVEKNTIFGKYRIAGINLRNVEVQLDTSRLVTIADLNNPNLYLLVESGKKYRIGDFWTTGEHDIFMRSLLEQVPITHGRNF